MSTLEQRFLIVSLGSIGRRHLRNLRTLRPHARIAVLRLLSNAPDPVEGCDLVLHSMDQVAGFAPQAAIIAAPASAHLALARQLAQLGVPLLIEKPLSDSLDGLRELIGSAAARGVPLMVGYNLRFKASLIEVRRRVLAGEIGQVLSVRAEVGQYLPDWRPGLDYRHSVSARASLGGGALLELSHEIDYLYWLFGQPQWVSCRGGRYSALEIDVEDTVELCLEYERPARIVSVHMDFIARTPSRSCKLVGTEGTLVWDGIRDRIELSRPGDAPQSLTLAMADGNQPYLHELQHFLDCAASGAAPLIDARQGYEVMAIVAAARRSMQHRTVERPAVYES